MPLARLAPTLLILLVCADGWRAGTAWAESPSSERFVRRIEWHGLASAEPDELEGAILTTEKNWRPWAEKRPFDQGTLEQDEERIRRFYRRRGYYQARVESEAVPSGRSAVVVRFEIDEGDRIQTTRFALSIAADSTATTEEREDADERGATDAVEPSKPGRSLDSTELARDLPLSEGDAFSPERYELARTALERRLAERGYPKAEIAGGAEVDVEAGTASVSWRIVPGPLVRLGAATVTGLSRTKPALVLREVGWQVGDRYDPAALRRTQRAVYALGLFRAVTVRPASDAPHAAASETGAVMPAEVVWPIEIEVLEREPRALRASVGFGTEDQVRGTLEWRQRAFFGGLRRLKLLGKYSFLERGAELVFVQPRFVTRSTELTIDTLFSQETEPGFDAQGMSLGWLIEHGLTKSWSLRVGERYEWRRVTSVKADTTAVVLDEDESFRLHLFQLGVRRSTVDKVLDPRSGTWLDVSAEPSVQPLGSDVDYIRAIAEGRVFFPLPAKLVLATRVRLGVLEPLGGDGAGDVPVFKRFFSGGGATVRGFNLDQLGPIDKNDEPIGGFTLAEGSVELRFPIWRSLGGVVFGDAGQVALDSFELQGRDFFYSVGGGLRYQTPIGPLRLDFAQVLNPPSGLGGFNVHFSVGHTF